LGTQFFDGGYTQKYIRNVVLPTDIRHVLKFRKDPFRVSTESLRK